MVVRRLPAARYRIMNRLGRRPQRFVTRMPPSAGRMRFVCDLRDSIAREVHFNGAYEPQETALCHALLQPHMTFIDVGANWGYFTLLATQRVGPAGRVLSLEPDPRLYRLLTYNVRLNHLLNVTTLKLAVAHQRGLVTLIGFDENEDNWGLSRLADHACNKHRSFLCATQRLDHILDQHHIGTADLVKLDIEGAEDLAVQGMTEGLAACRYKRILLEVHPRLLEQKGRCVADVIAPIASCGFKGYWINHSPGLSRQAAYKHCVRIDKLLSPVTELVTEDKWPHMLWLAPGILLPEVDKIRF